MKKVVRFVFSILLCLLMATSYASLLSVSAATSSVPGKVTGLKLSKNDETKQTLTWNKVDKASGYYIYCYNTKSGNQSYVKIGSTQRTTYAIKKLKNATGYYYRISAYNKAGEGKFSSVLRTATIGKPNGVKLSAVGTTWQTLRWNAVPGATGYRVYRYIDSAWVKVSDTSATCLKVTGLSAGSAYTYRMRAFVSNGAFTSYGTCTSNVQFSTAPEQVRNVTLAEVQKTDNISLKWTADAKATAYEILVLDEQSGKYKVAATDIKGNSFLLDGLDPSTKYSLKVRAYCDNNNIAYGAASDRIVVTTAPKAITGIVAEPTSNSIVFSWPQETDINSYEVQIFDEEKNEWVTKQDSITASYTQEGLHGGQQVSIRVRAYRIEEETKVYGDYSDLFYSVSLPDTPSKAAVTLITNPQVGSGSAYGVRIAWMPVPNATGYYVYRKMSAEPDTEWMQVCSTNQLSAQDLSIEADGFYQYKVVSYCVIDDEKVLGYSTEPEEIEYRGAQSRPDKKFDWTDLLQITNKNGVIGYSYDPVGGCFITADNPWQRNFGYSEMYDTFAPLGIMWYDTIRFKFNYNGLDWMIQLWKGQYGWVLNGCEIGVYTKSPDRDYDFYECADNENRIQMSVDCMFKQADGSFKRLFFRPYASYWWCTGFVFGSNYTNHDWLRMDMRLTMKDYTMLEAFTGSLEENGYTRNAVYQHSTTSYTVDGLDVYFSFQ